MAKAIYLLTNKRSRQKEILGTDICSSWGEKEDSSVNSTTETFVHRSICLVFLYSQIQYLALLRDPKFLLIPFISLPKGRSFIYFCWISNLPLNI